MLPRPSNLFRTIIRPAIHQTPRLNNLFPERYWNSVLTTTFHMEEPSSKRVRSDVTIGTHNGHFHADEALAVHMLRLLPTYRSAELVRTRDQLTLAKLHTVVDVGSEYDPQRNRFDHHQKGFATTFPGRNTKLSSAGLVYMHFGKTIIASALAAARSLSDVSTSGGESSAKHETIDENHPDVELIHKKLYESFIEAVDANDNGISQHGTPRVVPADASCSSASELMPVPDFGNHLQTNASGAPVTIPQPDNSAAAAGGTSGPLAHDMQGADKFRAVSEKRFKTGGFTLSAVVSRRNPLWVDGPVPQEQEDARFEEASQRIGEEFELELAFYTRSWLPARLVVENAFEERLQHDNKGRIMVFSASGVPWKDHLYDLEERMGTMGQVLYVLYREQPVPDAKWRIQCVPASSDSFESRRPLPQQWRGVRDSNLDQLTGIPDCVFVHSAGFIGGNKTFEGVLQMAKKALEMQE